MNKKVRVTLEDKPEYMAAARFYFAAGIVLCFVTLLLFGIVPLIFVMTAFCLDTVLVLNHNGHIPVNWREQKSAPDNWFDLIPPTYHVHIIRDDQGRWNAMLVNPDAETSEFNRGLGVGATRQIALTNAIRKLNEHLKETT